MPPFRPEVITLLRRREARGRQLRPCLVCGTERWCVLYESWQPGGLLHRRRRDVHWRWHCPDCGTRVPTTADDLRHAQRPARSRGKRTTDA